MRKTRLVDCNPRWVTGHYAGRDDDTPVGVHFDCPEGHEGCDHAIPFTPALDGGPAASWYRSSAIWQRSGDTFDTLVLSPSIRRVPGYASREEAIARGCLPHNVTESMLCACHIFIGGSAGNMPGMIEFCGDSR